MRKFLAILILLTAISYKLQAAVYAVTSTPSDVSTPSAAPADKRAQDLLDRVATKVAELSNQTRRTYHGPVKSIGTNSYTISTIEGDKFINTNDATSFFRIRAGNRSEIDFKSIKVGDDLAALGTIDPQTIDMTAKQVIAKIQRFNFVGTLSAVDKDDIGSITNADNTAEKVDLSSAIALKMLDSNNKIVAAKLANFKEGNQIFVLAHSPDSKTGVYSVLKAITLTK